MPRIFLNLKTTSAGALGGSITGTAVDKQNLDQFVFQCNVTSASSLNANLQLMGSNDNVTFAAVGAAVNVTANGTKWIPDPTAATGMHAYRYARLDSANVGGTGNLDVIFMGQGAS